MAAIEVFKTDLVAERDAHRLCATIRERFPQYSVNFDLSDCDRIMRVMSSHGLIDVHSLVLVAGDANVHIAPLPDEVPA